MKVALFLAAVCVIETFAVSSLSAAAFSFPIFSASVADASAKSAISAPERVAVAGATGRTGSLVVKELLDRNVNVVALVRDPDKAAEILPLQDSNLSVVKCDLVSKDEIRSAVQGCDAALWCATGFSDAPQSFFDKLKSFMGTALAPKQSIDSMGVPALAESVLPTKDESSIRTPKVVMLSSAGVTRPSWDKAKKERFVGSADIPIVRLNPFGILDIKAESEDKLRKTGVDYCIFRPTGLSEDWPADARPIFSQGDVAVGRINRKDVAKILVDILTEPEAVGKTFEAFSLQGYPPAQAIGPALSRLKPDSEGLPSLDVLEATYSSLQQLLPGETQDASKLAMGQTYEQLDKGEVGRFGERGGEDAEAAAPKPSS